MKKLTVKLEYEDGRTEATLTTLGSPSDERIRSLYNRIREIVNGFNDTTKRFQNMDPQAIPGFKGNESK